MNKGRRVSRNFWQCILFSDSGISNFWQWDINFWQWDIKKFRQKWLHDFLCVLCIHMWLCEQGKWFFASSTCYWPPRGPRGSIVFPLFLKFFRYFIKFLCRKFAALFHLLSNSDVCVNNFLYMLWASSSTEPKNIVVGKKVRLTSFLASFTHNFYPSSGPVKIVSMSKNYRKLFGNYSQKLPKITAVKITASSG